MATEYHNRRIDGRRLSWRVDRLRERAEHLEARDVPLSSIFEFDTVYWFDDDFPPTCRAVVEHAQRIASVDLAEPILLSPDGWLIDGMHRVAKAFLEGRTSIAARTLEAYPEPDRAS